MDRSRPFERHDLVKRITALEANRSELLARAERAKAVVAALPDPSTAEELREKIAELLGSTDEALLHAFLEYAWSETARIAGWEMAARWQAEDEAGRLRAELAGASDALCDMHLPGSILDDLPEDGSCRNCKGTGRVDDVRTASITRRATTVRRKCRVCQGAGEQPQPEVVPVESASGDIPDWMLGLDEE